MNRDGGDVDHVGVWNATVAEIDALKKENEALKNKLATIRAYANSVGTTPMGQHLRWALHIIGVIDGEVKP